MCLNEIKPVFGVSDKARGGFRQSETQIEISLVASLVMILSKKGITNALISLGGCACWSVPLLLANPEDRFSCVEAHMFRLRDKKLRRCNFLLIWTYKSMHLYEHLLAECLGHEYCGMLIHFTQYDHYSVYWAINDSQKQIRITCPS